MFEISEKKDNVMEGARIKVIGVGGGGSNAVNTMINAGLTGVEYIVCNTDLQALKSNLAPIKVQLGVSTTKGLGAGANPEVGKKAALDEYEKLSEIIKDADMVFITAGMGGGTGTGAAPVIAKLAKEMGALTVGVVTKPFLFEGKKRFRQAEAGIANLEENVDSLITIPNQRLLFLAGENLSLIDTFKKADDVLLNAVRGIADLINSTGFINCDFADVSTVMANKGLALMGTGIASGTDRAIKAATDAISSPLLEDISIDGATGIIINITGSQNMTMHEINEAATLIMEAADEEAEIIVGHVFDNNMGESVKVTVIATGLGGLERVTTKSVREVHKSERPEVEEVTMMTQDTYGTNDVGKNKTEHHSTMEPLQTRITESATSNLVKTIKEAASQYEQDKKGFQSERTTNANPVKTKPVLPEIKRSTSSAVKAKTIAEKLGFINFDEEELDTPTFLRRDLEVTENNIN
ncbi:MAG: cell division protein FtsZ [Bdellovibrionales bacterium RIFOXYB1_FULL_37_110]|nr:MAG: cell division protein FtsZ [Bdellovibrionales bacterium RIFOXYA1_FULL_38_20]OFZ47361.1 MAG: cell division protein FtsZ [Bdellovibrionales bacterium RIFOXYC1_FULL_37_79]OFZ58508.1 MAG: cell division protein FtsZ [Bdellovibrionales bacterium RIFOXYB1_FULL_37_110]OFZ63556.1 MAG: cell division protein FtsZ [Bdellovibrionales bacterium RIFOXYD1_FULL_36_51]